MIRLAEIRARLDAAQAKDRDDSGPYRFTPARGPDPHKDAAIWGPDGDQIGTAYGNLALGIDGDALADLWAHAPQDLAWLLEEIAAIAEALNCCGQPILERIEEFYCTDRAKTNEINILTREVRAQETLLRNETDAETERAALAAEVERLRTALDDIAIHAPAVLHIRTYPHVDTTGLVG